MARRVQEKTKAYWESTNVINFNYPTSQTLPAHPPPALVAHSWPDHPPNKSISSLEPRSANPPPPGCHGYPCCSFRSSLTPYLQVFSSIQMRSCFHC